jgi:hypothetical protein
VLRSLGLDTGRVEVLDVSGFSDSELVRLAAGTRHRWSEPYGDPHRRGHEITDISPADLRVILEGVVRVAIASTVREETTRALNKRLGRVD